MSVREEITCIKITVPGRPVPKARARTVRLKGGRSVSFTPDKTAAWELKIQAAAMEVRPEKLWDEPLRMTTEYILQRPKSKPKRVQHPATKPDLDNLDKSVKDALEGLIYTNDSRIVESRYCKRYGEPERVEITISRADMHRGRMVKGGLMASE